MPRVSQLSGRDADSRHGTVQQVAFDLSGVDTDGAFTDFFLWRHSELRVHRVLSTPEAPERAILQGVHELQVSFDGLVLIHGSTVAINALLDAQVAGELDALAKQGLASLAFEGDSAASCMVSRSLNLRYVGYTVNVAWSDLKSTEPAFHHAHAERYGDDLALPLERVNLTIAVTGPVPAINLGEAPNVRLPKTVVRDCYVADCAASVTWVRRSELPVDHRLAGPAVITERVATTWLAAHWEAAVDPVGNLQVRGGGELLIAAQEAAPNVCAQALASGFRYTSVRLHVRFKTYWGGAMINGVLGASWWQLVLVGLVLTHITIVTVTVYLHRGQAHRALDFHPVLNHFFRFWLWLTTGMVVREWVAVHRRHHAKCETPEDPHSPQIEGINKVLWEGAELYREAIRDQSMIARYGNGTPDDWLEHKVYSKYRWQGPGILLIVEALLFGAAGVALWAIQMMWIPFWAAGVINGIGHYWGYRNFQSPDASTNIVPWGIVIGGEELHNNHHAFPSSAKMSVRPWEFDIGWLYIRLFSAFGLAKVRRVAQRPRIDASKTVIDMDTVKAVVVHRMFVLSRYARDVVRPVMRKELCANELGCRQLYRQAKKLLAKEESRMDAPSRARLAKILEQSQVLATVHNFRAQLKEVWERTATSQDALLQALQEWCRQAEATGIKSLEDFSRSLRGYLPALSLT